MKLLFQHERKNKISHIQQEIYDNGVNKVLLEFQFIGDLVFKLENDEDYKIIGKEMIKLIKEKYNIGSDE